MNQLQWKETGPDEDFQDALGIPQERRDKMLFHAKTVWHELHAPCEELERSIDVEGMLKKMLEFAQSEEERIVLAFRCGTMYEKLKQEGAIPATKSPFATFIAMIEKMQAKKSEPANG